MAIDLGTAIEPKPLLSARSSNVGVQPGSWTLRYDPGERKRPSEGKKVLRLEDTKARNITNHPQHIYRLPSEIALKVFSRVGDEDVTKVRSTSRWFGFNMSDRFAEYCAQALDKKLTSNDKSWELSLTRSSMNELMFICRIPRVAPLITSVSINADCPNRAGVRIFEKIERVYQDDAPPDRKRTLQDFRTLESTPMDGLFRSFRQMKRSHQRRSAAHATYAVRGEDVSELIKIFELLTHLKLIRIGGWSKNVDVDYIDLMSDAWRTDVPGLYNYAYDCNEDEELLVNAHDDCLQHAFEVAMAAIGSSKLTLDSSTVIPTILKTAAFLGPQGDDVVDGTLPLELIEQVEMADGPDRMIRLSVSEPPEQCCWYSD